MAPSSNVTNSTAGNSSAATGSQQQGDCSKKKKAGRGKTTGISVSKRKEKSATGKLHVLIPPGKMVAVGPGAPDFVTEISVQVQKRAPFNVKKWKKVPDEAKNDIVSRVYTITKLSFLLQQIDSTEAIERDPETGKEPNYQDLWRMTHTNNSGVWINEASREVHVRVEEASMRMLEETDEDADEDPIINKAFKSVVGERSGYSRGLGAGIQPTKGKSTAGLHEQLVSEREKRQGIEMKLKAVESQLLEERNIREEMATRIEDSQKQLEEREKQFEERVEKQLEERMEKKFEERMAAFFCRTQLAGQYSQG
ncbi:uncharacterized protein LOC130737896 isoform X1 [Lotus japonicus]|uniref:uncharacterized protein LOC130737896 isoform X1 n=1 Tax=Lotus japonicus TaxID=34305 RepID=UPI002582ED7B|nr:uncharacterized protein LOC130737896 isoform X1 [Lotus japonicus]XP_057445738.1 uncharacterized protein LOC130737896 isoform X1 [Lotus japonicus]